MSRSTKSPVPTSDRALVVGTPNAAIASEARNSLTLLLMTALPSANLEYGVRPAPWGVCGWVGDGWVCDIM